MIRKPDAVPSQGKICSGRMYWEAKSATRPNKMTLEVCVRATTPPRKRALPTVPRAPTR